MLINLERGISLKIEGELGKFQTLPVDSLIKIAESLQDLVTSIAKHDLPKNEPIDIQNFKLELTDFQKGSSIPTFALTPRANPVISADFNNQRKEVTRKLNILFSVSDKGTYYDLKEIYPDYMERNIMVEKLYGFTNSFNNSPVTLYEKGNFENRFQPKRFKTSVKNSLLQEIILQVEEEEKLEEKAFARITIIKKGDKTRNKIQEVILPKHHSISYSPEVININKRQYILNYPLRCLFEKEEGYYIINHEALDIIGTGLTMDEAEENFNQEFDYLYNRLNSLKDNELNKRLLRVKYFLNSYVKDVHLNGIKQEESL